MTSTLRRSLSFVASYIQATNRYLRHHANCRTALSEQFPSREMVVTQGENDWLVIDVRTQPLALADASDDGHGTGSFVVEKLDNGLEVDHHGTLATEMEKVCDLTEDIKVHDGYPAAHGGYSDIFKGEWTLSSGSATSCTKVTILFVAVKALRVFSKQGVDLEHAQKRLNREVNVLRRLKHPNVAQFYGIAFHQGRRPSVVMKWYERGTTPDYLKSQPDVDRMGLIRDVAKGLEYLHTLEPPVVHGDLKGSNTLVDEDGRVVLSDFGLSKVLEEVSGPSGFTTTQPGGSIRWLAPEFLFDPDKDPDSDSGNPEPAVGCTTAGDIWALASVAYEFISGIYPYGDEKFDWNVIQAISKGRTPVRTVDTWLLESVDVLDVLKKCWAQDPAQRPRIRDVCQMFSLCEMVPRKAS